MGPPPSGDNTPLGDARFLPAYIGPDGHRTTVPSRGRRDPKRYYYDSIQNQYITERQYVRLSQGWSKEAKARARRSGFSSLADLLAGRINPELRSHVWYESWITAFQRAHQDRTGEYLSRQQVRNNPDFNAGIDAIKAYEEQRKEAKRNRLDTARFNRQQRARYDFIYNDITDPNGDYAALLVWMGKRDPGSRVLAGESPPKRGVGSMAA